MIITPTPIEGAFLVTPQPVEDERGSFGRLYCAEAFAAARLDPRLEQISFSHNRRRGTLRGLHLQRPPHAEVKLIRATAGAVFDVIVDLRAGSASFGQWHAVELNAADRRQLYVPKGVAHGFQSLTDDAELVYHISTHYAPDAQDGVRWDDPDLAIAWPDAEGAILSARDRALPSLGDFEPVAAE